MLLHINVKFTMGKLKSSGKMIVLKWPSLSMSRCEVDDVILRELYARFRAILFDKNDLSSLLKTRYLYLRWLFFSMKQS